MANNIQDVLKELSDNISEEMLMVKLEENLDYEYIEKSLSLNTRNSYSSKEIKGTNGEIKILRDRKGSLEP